MGETWHVYYWRIPDPGSVGHESFATYEEAAKFYDEIMERGYDWDAYITTDPLEFFNDQYSWS